MTAELGSATNLDCRHDAPLGQAHVAGVGGAPRVAMESENIGYLQPRPEHLVGPPTPFAPARAQHPWPRIAPAPIAPAPIAPARAGHPLPTAETSRPASYGDAAQVARWKQRALDR